MNPGLVELIAHRKRVWPPVATPAAMSKPKRLPDRLTSKIISFGEASYGAYRVALVIDDGTIVDDVLVAWGRDVVSVGGVSVPAFDASHVIDVIDKGPTSQV